tara:strand:- start:51 stop:686 length:636 start_codon:yes stop_codon:yes gene_type:complete
MEEDWKIIDGFPDYKISTLGNIMSKKWGYWRQLNPCPDKDGYLRINLTDENKKKKYCGVHRLLAIVFIPNPDNLPTVDHIDQNSKNNDLSNLRWATYKTQNYNRTNTRYDITETDPDIRDMITTYESYQRTIDSKKYYCETCYLACQSQSELDIHLSRPIHHRILNFKPTTPHSCRPCGSSLSCKSALKKHLEGPNHTKRLERIRDSSQNN